MRMRLLRKLSALSAVADHTCRNAGDDSEVSYILGDYRSSAHYGAFSNRNSANDSSV
jgi:hypothetical protein